MKMIEEAGNSLLSSTTKSYGATNSRMLTVIDTKVITHKVQPSDTLQGLAIKYGVTVEKLKRVNKLWTNDTILTKDNLLIPSEKGGSSDDHIKENTKTAYVKPETEEEIYEKKKKLKKEKEGEYSMESGSDGEFGSSSKENEYENPNMEGESKRLFNKLMCKADQTINQHKEEINRENCSEGFKEFNNILSKIDGQIQSHKNKNMDIPNPSAALPDIAYDSSYQNATSSLFSPTRQHPHLEQGI